MNMADDDKMEFTKSTDSTWISASKTGYKHYQIVQTDDKASANTVTDECANEAHVALDETAVQEDSVTE